MIEIKNLTKEYDGKIIVNGLTLTVKKGSIFGFLGPNGAGKTTTIKMLVGISTPTKGMIEVNGKNISDINNRSILGFMPEDPYFYDHLTAKEFLEFMASLSSNSSEQLSPSSEEGSGVVARTLMSAGGWIVKDRGAASQRATLSLTKKNGDLDPCKIKINDLLSMVSLSEAADQPIVNFSKGMKQRLGLAQALVNNPNYIFLDEPLDGLDPIGRREFKKIILDLKKQGKTIFFNSHVLSDVEEICDQIGIINKGKLIYSGDVNKFCGNKTLEEKFVEKIEASI